MALAVPYLIYIYVLIPSVSLNNIISLLSNSEAIDDKMCETINSKKYGDFRVVGTSQEQPIPKECVNNLVLEKDGQTYCISGEGEDELECKSIDKRIDTHTSTSFDAVLISGGLPDTSKRKVQLFNLKTKTGCDLPDLPADRYKHTSVRGVLCGGGPDQGTRTSCISFNPTSKSWSSGKYQPIRPRDDHVSWKWKKDSFILLGGGRDSENTKTSDIVFNNGEVKPGEKQNLPIDLKY